MQLAVIPYILVAILFVTVIYFSDRIITRKTRNLSKAAEIIIREHDKKNNPDAPFVIKSETPLDQLKLLCTSLL